MILVVGAVAALGPSQRLDDLPFLATLITCLWRYIISSILIGRRAAGEPTRPIGEGEMKKRQPTDTETEIGWSAPS